MATVDRSELPRRVTPQCDLQRSRYVSDIPERGKWRRERDSNPRWAFGPYALSRGAPSTTRPSLRYGGVAGGPDDTGRREAGSKAAAARTLRGGRLRPDVPPLAA